MSKLNICLFSVLILLILSACSPQAAPPANPLPTITSEPKTATAADTGQPTNSPTSVAAEPDYCLECHIDQQKLMDTASPEAEMSGNTVGAGMVGEVPSVAPWENVLVDSQTFPGSIHGLNGCISCHGGVNSPEKDVAHNGVEDNPSQDPEAVCGECHLDIVSYAPYNLHSTSSGFMKMLDARAAPGAHSTLQEAVDQQCSSCHSTCGECHVSKPDVVGGGFVNGHLFNREPSVQLNCNACHASRVGDEYFGNHEQLAADVHYRQGEMECAACHSPRDLHGKPAECSSCHPGPENATLQPTDHRLGGIQSPRCESCHPNVDTDQDENLMHQQHGGDLSCQVCHSIEYTSCNGCHVGIDRQTGKPFSELESSYLTFLIGRNPLKSYDRPYEFVPLRHVPVTPDTFDYYGKDLLSNFDSLETWKYATPHNIQRNTPQTQSCNACHGNPALFLTADKVAPEELDANRDVIMESIPPEIKSSDQLGGQ